jgi:hypothetical protein
VTGADWVGIIGAIGAAAATVISAYVAAQGRRTASGVAEVNKGVTEVKEHVATVQTLVNGNNDKLTARVEQLGQALLSAGSDIPKTPGRT